MNNIKLNDNVLKKIHRKSKQRLLYSDGSIIDLVKCLEKNCCQFVILQNGKLENNGFCKFSHIDKNFSTWKNSRGFNHD